MNVTVKEIQRKLNDVWPSLNQIWCFDQEYLCPSVDEVKVVIDEAQIEFPNHLSDYCNYTALQVHVKVIEKHNWSFGQAFGNKIDGWSLLHNLNIAVCQEGVYLIDKRKGYIRVADPVKDNILWVRMT